MKRLISAASALCITLCLISGASAHEMYYYRSINVPIELNWTILSGGKAWLKINTDFLDPIGTPSYTVWSSHCPNEVTISEVQNFANVFIGTATEDGWAEIFSNDFSMYYSDGITMNYTSDGLLIERETPLIDIYNSSGEVVSASVIMSPYVDTSAWFQKALTHELGHVLCLGHPDRDYYSPVSSSTTSVMRGTGYSSTPQAHDTADIAAKY